MIDHAFLMLIASLGVSLAGFAALLHAFRGGRQLSALGSWRIRMIVELGFAAAVIALGAIAVDAMVENDRTAVRVASGLFLLAKLRPWWYRSLADQDVYRNTGQVAATLVAEMIQIAVAVTNVVVASSGLLLVIYILLLVNPMSIFIRFVGEIYTPPQRG